MKATLLDEGGMELTEITSHGVAGQMVVDWATRPDSVFQYYFDRGRRLVTVVADGERCTALLGTRWQMGARFWFLHTFRPLERTKRGVPAEFAKDTTFAFARQPGFEGVPLDVPAQALRAGPRSDLA